jgi:hypothetical protein
MQFRGSPCSFNGYGDVSIIIKRPSGEDNTFPFKGRVFITAKEIAGGYGKGKIKCTINGKVKDGAMKARVYGMVVTGGGFTDVSGTFGGTMSKTQASGIWQLSHSEGFHYGKWTAEKADIPSID